MRPSGSSGSSRNLCTRSLEHFYLDENAYHNAFVVTLDRIISTVSDIAKGLFANTELLAGFGNCQSLRLDFHGGHVLNDDFYIVGNGANSFLLHGSIYPQTTRMVCSG